MKLCSKCSIIKPLTDFYFKKNQNRYDSQCKSCVGDYVKHRYKTIPSVRARYAETSKKWNNNNRERLNESTRKRTYRYKIEAISHYSNGLNCCACCGESNIQFLTIDHIDNNGANHRRAMNHSSICDWLKFNDYPSGYQVLCWNCNCGKAFNTISKGICPHKLTDSS